MADYTERVPVAVPQFGVNIRMKKTLEKVLTCKCIPEDLKNQCSKLLQQNKEKALISTKQVREIYNTLRSEGHKVFLHELVEDAQFEPPTLSLPPRNPELEARIQKLKVEEENKEYKRMIKNVDPKVRKEQKFTFQEDVKSMNRQTVALLNFVLTVVAGFAFGYKGTELMFGKVFAMQMMSGLILGTVVFFVDLYFILRYGI